MRIKSLHGRLIVTSGIWIVLTLTLTGWLLIYLFETHIERRFDALLFDHLEEIVAAAEHRAGGTVHLNWIPSDARFRKHDSGWYWQIERDGTVLARSHSLSDQRLAMGGNAANTQSAFDLEGPLGQRLRGMTESITKNVSGHPINIIVTGPVAEIRRDVSEFTRQISIVLAALGVGLIMVVIGQVYYGLHPLRKMQNALTDIREGKANRMPEDWPDEVRSVVVDLNKLLDHNWALIERARSQAGNLAHTLKNPLTVIRNEAHQLENQHGRVIREQANAIHVAIDRYSTQARTAGATNLLSTPVSVSATLGELSFTMDRLYRDRDLNLRIEGCDNCCFRGEEQDLEEMLGNLMDNAYKWAGSEVVVRCECRDDRLVLSIEDDGPGIPDAHLSEATQRGTRLDEAKPGTGLGLSIVRDIATLYHGSLTLSRSPLGGLKTQLYLPFTQRPASSEAGVAGSLQERRGRPRID